MKKYLLVCYLRYDHPITDTLNRTETFFFSADDDNDAKVLVEKFLEKQNYPRESERPIWSLSGLTDISPATSLLGRDWFEEDKPHTTVFGIKFHRFLK